MTPAEIAASLSEAESYCAWLLTEEMGEMAQALGKAGRFGLDTPGVKRMDGTINMGLTPRIAMAIEAGDMLAAIDFIIAHGIIDRADVQRSRARKIAKLLDPSARDNLGRPLAPQPNVAVRAILIGKEQRNDNEG